MQVKPTFAIVDLEQWEANPGGTVEAEGSLYLVTAQSDTGSNHPPLTKYFDYEKRGACRPFAQVLV